MEIVPISLIIPYYNEEDSLPTTFRCIENLTLLPSEIIFVNSSSSDQSEKLINQWAKHLHSDFPSVRNVFEGSNTPASSKNVGIKKANFEWLAFMDCGLRFPANWLASQWKLHLQYKDIRFLSCQGKFKGDGLIDCVAIAHSYGYLRPRPIMPSSLVHSSVYKEIGLYEEGRRAGYDADWQLKAKQLGISRIINQEIIIEYVGTNFGSSLQFIFKKSILYAEPSVGLKYYKTPYYHLLLILLIFISLFFKFNLLILWLIIYILGRGFALAFYKSRGIQIVKDRPLSVIFLPIVAFVIDAGKTIGFLKGFWKYHLK